ncbi:MAG: transposase [Verrucomicrobia bacterium]|nr:transposase [Verrucomicrobiota bacterium]MDA7680092.1 transposase [bacterium]MDC0319090.1 transposase [Verrucomicrobiota bacterium]
MKGKRYTTETKIRILREGQSRDKTIQDVCRERQISEQIYIIIRGTEGIVQFFTRLAALFAEEELI